MSFFHVDSLMSDDTVEPSWENNLSFLFMQPFIFTKSRNFGFVRLLSACGLGLKSVRKDGIDQKNHGIIKVGKVNPAAPPCSLINHILKGHIHVFRTLPRMVSVQNQKIIIYALSDLETRLKMKQSFRQMK